MRKPRKYEPIKPLGNGASLCQEASHFIHGMGNKITILVLRMEVAAIQRKERRQARRRHMRALKRAQALRRKTA